MPSIGRYQSNPRGSGALGRAETPETPCLRAAVRRRRSTSSSTWWRALRVLNPPAGAVIPLGRFRQLEQRRVGCKPRVEYLARQGLGGVATTVCRARGPLGIDQGGPCRLRGRQLLTADTIIVRQLLHKPQPLNVVALP